MPGHYDALRAQLTDDIRSVIGLSAPVLFGEPRREVPVPNAVCSTRMVRAPGHPDGGPRRRVEAYEIAINLRVPVPNPYPENGHEAYTMGLAAALCQLIDPYSVPPDALPTRTAYAGVVTRSYVTAIESVGTEDTDDYVAIRLVAQFLTQVGS